LKPKIGKKLNKIEIKPIKLLKETINETNNGNPLLTSLVACFILGTLYCKAI
jgi:hypothetical protein